MWESDGTQFCLLSRWELWILLPISSSSSLLLRRQKAHFYLSGTCVCVVVRKLMVWKSFSDSSHLTGIYVDEQDTANDEWMSVDKWHCAHQGWRPNSRKSHDGYLREGLYQVKHTSCVSLCCRISSNSWYLLLYPTSPGSSLRFLCEEELTTLQVPFTGPAGLC